MRLARYGSKLHVRKTWEINVEAIQARAGSVRPKPQGSICPAPAFLVPPSHYRAMPGNYVILRAATLPHEFPFQ